MNVLIIIFVTAVLSLFLGVFNKGNLSRIIGLLGLGCSFYISYFPDCPFFEKYQLMYSYTYQAMLFTRISIIVVFLIFLISGFAFSNHRRHQAELYALMLFSLCGGIVLFGVQNLVTVFIGIEILSIPLYVMAGSEKGNVKSIEAAMKYFLMGAFSTGFLLFGIALIYGSTGTFDLHQISLYAIVNSGDKMMSLGLILMMVAMVFKVSLAPFHMWSPDVYEGAPSIITAFMASFVKISGFYILYKMLCGVFVGFVDVWKPILVVLIIITLVISNFMALVQSNSKRMLAYSSISHAGYVSLVFLGIIGAKTYGFLAFYLLAYSFATVGVFMCLIWVKKMKNEVSYEAFKGLAKSEPILALVATVSLLSMAGIPLTAGFIGKLSIFTHAIDGNLVLIIIAVLASAVSITYYLKLIISMFFNRESTFKGLERVSVTYNIVAILIILLILALGVWPSIFNVL